jgi:uncharacterized protein
MDNASGAETNLAIALERPGEREFVRDLAGMISQDNEQEIRKICDKLLTDKATPIIVVTIRSMAGHGGTALRIETFARLLFDQWQIGQARLGQHEWNTGILLLVSQGDRKARIELGAGWKHDKDDVCRRIMDEQIVPRFKSGNFSEGIVAGVKALDKMARDLELPRQQQSGRSRALMIGIIALGAFSVFSLIRSGSKGLAWLLWGAVFAIIGVILYQLLFSRGRAGSGFSGGSFGGGFSGGGGATGSW